jgi:prevent-host-death family protein
MTIWQLQDAKARLSEVVKKASSEGPQHITVHGEPSAVLISETDYRRLTRPAKTLIDFIRDSPLHGVELDLERDRSPVRVLTL